MADVRVVCASHSPMMLVEEGGPGGQEFLEGIAQVRELIGAFAPDRLVMFAPDHFRALTSVVPAWALVRSATAYGDYGTSNEEYLVDGEFVKSLADVLGELDLDIATASNLRLDHGFTITLEQLFDSVRAVPIAPIVVNCVVEPVARLSRFHALGSAVGEFLSGLDEKVLVIGSGGLSHSPPGLGPGVSKLTDAERKAQVRERMAEARNAINPGWDRAFLDLLSEGRIADACAMTPKEVRRGGTGAEEIRTWLAAAATGGTPLRTLRYVPVEDWITGMGLAVSQHWE